MLWIYTTLFSNNWLCIFCLLDTLKAFVWTEIRLKNTVSAKFVYSCPAKPAVSRRDFDCFMRQTLQKDKHWFCFQKSHITYRLSVLTLACLISVSPTAHSFHWGPQKQHLTFSLEAFRPKEQHCCCTKAWNNRAWYLVSWYTSHLP